MLSGCIPSRDEVLAALPRDSVAAGKTTRQAEEEPALPSHFPMRSCFNFELHVRARVRRGSGSDETVGGRFFGLVALFLGCAPMFGLETSTTSRCSCTAACSNSFETSQSTVFRTSLL
jgi:hypothetical protein